MWCGGIFATRLIVPKGDVRPVHPLPCPFRPGDKSTPLLTINYFVVRGVSASAEVLGILGRAADALGRMGREIKEIKEFKEIEEKY